MAVFNEDYPTGFFNFNYFELKFAGMWVPPATAPHQERLFFWTINTLYLTWTQVYFTLAELYILPYMASDLVILMRLLGIGFTHNLGSFKVLSYFKNRRRIFKIIETLESSEFHYPTWKELDFYPGLYIKKAQKLSTYYNKFFFVFANTVAAAQYAAGIVFFLTRPSADFESGKVECYKILPYIAWVPFNVHTKIGCGLGILFLWLPVFVYAWQIPAHDTMFIALLAYARAHLQILVKAFNTIRHRSLLSLGLPLTLKMMHDKEYPELDRKIRYEMRKCSRHLQTVIWVCQEIENSFTYTTLGQTLMSLFIIASCLYMVSSIPILSGAFASQAIYLSAMIYQIASYCWFGNQVTITGELIPSAIYTCDWLSASRQYKSSMVINMMRMIRPLHFTVGKFTPLTLSTLVTILRGSYSYFTVLKQTQD